MQERDVLLERAESFIHGQSGEYLSDLQRIILVEALSDHPRRKTYDQIATETGYSSKYVKQVVAPQLWQLLSDIVGQRIQKSNVRNILIPTLQSHLGNTEPTLTPSETPISPEDISLVDSSPLPQLSASNPVEEPTGDEMDAVAAMPPPYTPETFPEPSPPSSSVETIGGRGEEAIAQTAKAVVLLVDDQPQNLALLSDMLENEGYEVRQAINGALALRVAVNNPPNIILLDVNMPGMDGYEVCRQLKANPQTQAIPIIFVSALHETWDKVKAFSVGGNDYITKPLKVMEVIVRIENQLKIQRSQHQLYCLSKQLKYTQRVLADLGLFDTVLGILNRAHFDTVLQKYWQQSLQTQQSLSLILCQIKSSPKVQASEDIHASDAIPNPQSASHWLPLIQTILGSIDHHSPILATYDMSSSPSLAQGIIAILLTRTDLMQRKAIVRALAPPLQAQAKSMHFDIMFGGSSLVPNHADEWAQLIKMAEQSLELSNSSASPTNIQARPL